MASGQSDDNKPLSEKARSSSGCLVAFFGLFFFAGLAAAIPTIVFPIDRVIRSSSWTKTPCTIVSSGVHTSSGEDGSTYAPQIEFRYIVNGQAHTSTRAWPLSAHYGNNDAVDLSRRYRAHSAASCYVNPSNPDEAILSRDLPTKSMLFSLIPLVFMAVGGGAIYFTLRRGTVAALGPGSSYSNVPTSQLKSKQGPVARLLGMMAVMLFWNGIVSVFVVQCIATYRHGHGDACMTAFLVPFVAIGLGMICGVVYFALALFNPRVQVTLSRSPLRPGDSSDIRWRFSGRSGRIVRLKIHLEGREEATFRRGTNTVTDKNVFYRQELVDTAKAFEIASGSAKMTIPPRTMHTFASRNNKIVWEIQVKGEIPHWPDVKEPLEVIVLPAEVAR